MYFLDCHKEFCKWDYFKTQENEISLLVGLCVDASYPSSQVLWHTGVPQSSQAFQYQWEILVGDFAYFCTMSSFRSLSWGGQSECKLCEIVSRAGMEEGISWLYYVYFLLLIWVLLFLKVYLFVACMHVHMFVDTSVYGGAHAHVYTYGDKKLISGVFPWSLSTLFTEQALLLNPELPALSNLPI